MLDRPRVWKWMLLAVAAGAMVEAARRSDPMGLRTLGEFTAAVMAFTATWLFLDWLWWMAAARYRQFKDAAAMSEKVKVVQAVSQLNDAQIRLLESGSGVVEVLAGEPKPIYVLRVGGGAIPFEFIEQFLQLGDGQYLCPVGTWGEGSKRREWAQLLTNHFVLMGFAEIHNGNKAARWVNEEGARRWIGLGQ